MADRDQETDEWLSRLENLWQRSKIKVLIWGPGEGHPLRDKRDQIRLGIQALGHQADFSEDIVPEDIGALGINLSVAELLQARAYDYIICLMASPGSIGEVHEFATRREIARKMLVCVDERHQTGFSAGGALRIFEGFSGKLDWYKDPQDIEECRLATRVINHIQKVAESKQYEIATREGGEP